jgi:hypothetical protein
MDHIVNSIVSEKYQQLEFLEEQERIQPALSLIELMPATALQEYDGKLVEVGVTTCPHCQALHEKLKPKILKGKADVLWVDRDPLGFFILQELNLDAVPVLFKVEVEGDKAVLTDVRTGEKHIFKDKISFKLGERKREKVKAKTQSSSSS